ncbi:MAG TPA: hypothetical protein PLZ53_04545 [Candidatus Hydrogenedentes bacterium]|jgi:hypothetical protein|nr:MAG: hypothetical protein BWY07_01363 [Candidatus Hydrogenedentes bacterium ADurb.Bin170]HNZ48471.1 hypothetical protein [Candidatus Hydrogenedentota bacterium]HOD95000.1 hypothetical protein [Candidatus Hydrogenedentota bacterium]HOH42362.1 hypothetical protein [Candidatus Hydrogenedentota bacterium]HOM47527.1 hypothetical protein [Candidatus Hydrogenedentota bacterium]
MKVQSFMGKVSMTGLRQMDIQINEWLQRSKVKPIHIKQSFGTDIHHEGRMSEPIVIITVWYEDESAVDK